MPAHKQNFRQRACWTVPSQTQDRKVQK